MNDRTRAKCSRCGRTVWFRQVATVGFSSWAPRGSLVYQWAARRGTKPRPMNCPSGDYHYVTGHAMVRFVNPVTKEVITELHHNEKDAV